MGGLTPPGGGGRRPGAAIPPPVLLGLDDDVPVFLPYDEEKGTNLKDELLASPE